MMEKVLTIVIPTYNMELYIARCLDSLLIKEGLESIQILVVNDGSKDKSSEIAHRYAEMYPSSIFVIDKDNGNYGSCINSALGIATGKYIKILDSDDYFDKFELEKLIKFLMLCEADVVLTNHTIITSKNKNLWKQGYLNNQSILLDEECPSYFTMHSVIYRTELLHKIRYHQTEGISYTDQEWIFYPILNANNMIYINLNLYQYCMNREGQTMDPKVFAKGLPMLYTIFFRALNYRKERKFVSQPTRMEYCDMQLLKQAETIYKQELVLNHNISSQLKTLDLKIKEIAPGLYDKLDRLSIGFCKYVKHYRETGKGISLISRLTLAIQCKIINLQYALLNRIKRLNG